MSDGVMRSVGYQNIQPEFQGNSRGLKKAVSKKKDVKESLSKKKKKK
jgi:hypothetical protein